MKMKDLTGKTFSKIIVESFSHSNGSSYWNCACECGNVKKIRGAHLTSGKIKSCGCIQKEITRERSTTHGHTVGRKSTREYKTWDKMKSRCFDINDKSYKDYGGRGIIVYGEWVKSFEKFYLDMGIKPDGTSIDRIDNNKGYYKENCRWATSTQQNNNKRNIIKYTYKGQTKSIAEFSRIYGLSFKGLYSRLRLYNYTIEEAITKPFRKTNKV